MSKRLSDFFYNAANTSAVSGIGSFTLSILNPATNLMSSISVGGAVSIAFYAKYSGLWNSDANDIIGATTGILLQTSIALLLNNSNFTPTQSILWSSALITTASKVLSYALRNNDLQNQQILSEEEPPLEMQTQHVKRQ